MKRSDITLLISIAMAAAIVSFLMAAVVFNPISKRTKVPVVQGLNQNFPDVKNDPAYQSFFYPGALDPTQQIQIGNTKNTSPFNASP